MGLRRILAVVSFLIYALTAIIVVNVFRSSWDIERPVSIPAAISNVVYGFQLGVIDSNVLEEFNKAADPGTPASVDKVVERVSRGSLNSGTATIAIDGIGIGQQIFVDLA